jgi:hypothetical protein
MSFSLFRRSSPDKVNTSVLKRAGRRIFEQLERLTAQNERMLPLIAEQHDFKQASTLELEASKFEVAGRKANGLALTFEGQADRTALLTFKTGRGFDLSTLPATVLRYSTTAAAADGRETVPVTAAAARDLPTNTQVTFSSPGSLDATGRGAHGRRTHGEVEISLRRLAGQKIAVTLSFLTPPQSSSLPLELGGRGKLFHGLWHEVTALTELNGREAHFQESFTLDLNEGGPGDAAFGSIFGALPGPLNIDLARLDAANTRSVRFAPET